MEIIKFEELQLDERILRAVADMGFEEVLTADSKHRLPISVKKVGNIKAALIAAFSNRRG